MTNNIEQNSSTFNQELALKQGCYAIMEIGGFGIVLFITGGSLLANDLNPALRAIGLGLGAGFAVFEIFKKK